MEAIIFHFPHISILWYFLTVVPVVKNNQIDKNTLRFTCYTFPHCASSNGLHGRIHNHTDYISTLSVFKCALKMHAQVDKKITSIAILLIFSAVAFQRFPHDTSTRAQKVTLIAFVWLFSNVRFYICPQLWPAG